MDEDWGHGQDDRSGGRVEKGEVGGETPEGRSWRRDEEEKHTHKQTSVFTFLEKKQIQRKSAHK